MFVVGANLGVPIFTVVLRKAYGLGAQAMAGGSLVAGGFCVSWPTGEFGGMGLEGAVRLGFRKELEAIADAGLKRQALHAAVLGFVHPVTGETLRFESPLPADMAQLQANLTAL